MNAEGSFPFPVTDAVLIRGRSPDRKPVFEYRLCQSRDGKAVLLMYIVRLKVTMRSIVVEVSFSFRKVR